MKPPRIPPLLVDLVQSGILACDGIVFASRDACPACGGDVSGYDTRQRQFAVMLKEDKPHPVHVFVKRFSCRQCRAVCFADEPFYPGTRTGSPVVDLCRTLAEAMPFHRTSTYLAHLGILLDRGTIRNYARSSFPEVPTTDLFGIRFPLSVVSLSSIAAGIREGSRIEGTEALAACGFPSAYRAAPHLPLPRKQGDERDEEEQDK